MKALGERAGYRNIICGVSGSQVSQKAVLGASLLCKENDAHLILVYAVDVSFVKGVTVELPSGFAEEQIERLGKRVLEEAEQIAKEEGVDCEKLMRTGSMVDVLAEVAAERGGDLLVLSLEPRSFFEKVLFRAAIEEEVEELRSRTGREVVVIR